MLILPINAPLDGPYDWDEFGVVRPLYIDSTGVAHTGIDLRSKTNNREVKAADAGVVTVSSGNDGSWVHIDHGNGIQTRYVHLVNRYFGVGQRVAQGQVMAVYGLVGMSTGAHLHFEVWKDGKRVDPRPYIFGGGDVKTENSMQQYQVKVGGWRSQVIQELIDYGVWGGTWQDNLAKFNELNPVTPEGGWVAGQWVNVKQEAQPIVSVTVPAADPRDAKIKELEAKTIELQKLLDKEDQDDIALQGQIGLLSGQVTGLENELLELRNKVVPEPALPDIPFPFVEEVEAATAAQMDTYSEKLAEEATAWTGIKISASKLALWAGAIATRIIYQLTSTRFVQTTAFGSVVAWFTAEGRLDMTTGIIALGLIVSVYVIARTLGKKFENKNN